MTAQSTTGQGSADDRDRSGTSTSRSLLAEAQLDDPAAWVRLVNLYAPLAAAWCRRGGIADQDVMDVLQEVFAAVARNLGRFRKEQPEDTFRGWLATITRNKVRDYYRARANHPAAAGGTEHSLRLAELPDPEAFLQGSDAEGSEVKCHTAASGNSEGAEATDHAFGEVLQRALESIRGEFHAQTWQAFWNVVVEGRTTADVAAELSMQPGAVRVCKSRVLSRLRRELGDIE